MERWLKGEVMRKRKLSLVFMLLLALLQPTESTGNITLPAFNYTLPPASINVAVGEPAVFCCEVSPVTEFNFILSGSQTYTLSCPNGNVGNSHQALHGQCEPSNDGYMAVWTIKRTSLFDNGTQVVCQLANHPDTPPAFLHVHDNRSGFFIIIGCTIGGFLGFLLVFGFSYGLIRRSETLQRCLRGREEEEEEDDTNTIVTKE